ncbi:MAG: hypothetical protein II604_06800 [Bacteroidales bacterium]|nr:hypothetical protein [Bacteroidales bacterium]
MKTKVNIQPWQLAKMKNFDFDKWFSVWKHENKSISHAFNRKSFLESIVQKYADFLIPSANRQEYSGIDFANIIAGVYSTKDAQVFVDCAFCVKYVTTIQRVAWNEVKVSYIKEKQNG